jgi:hypothetical protein
MVDADKKDARGGTHIVSLDKDETQLVGQGLCDGCLAACCWARDEPYPPGTGLLLVAFRGWWWLVRGHCGWRRL